MLQPYTFSIETAVGMPRLTTLDAQRFRHNEDAIKYARNICESFVNVPWFRHITIWRDDECIAIIRPKITTVVEDVIAGQVVP